ncbi:MAG: DUF1460 domain-containing protein [Ignavibacteriaceae bacterium]
MKLFKSILFIIIFSFPGISCTQPDNIVDAEILQSKFRLAIEKNLNSKPISEIITEIGKSFTGAAYIAHSLDINDEEKLVINLREFDCTTFTESVLSISRCIKKNELTFEAFKNELRFIRYRGGVIDEYPSRLHYFSDWIYDNQIKGVVKDITGELGGVKFKPELNFMSRHPKYYRQLESNKQFIDKIRKQESEISERYYSFIPKSQVKRIEEKILDGDIIAFTTNIEGLDIAHLGIAVKDEKGIIHLLHASQPGMPVYITEKNLTDYINSVPKFTGIMVVRPLEIK